MTRQSALAEEWPVNGAMLPAEGHIIQWHLLSPADRDLARKKRSNANRLGFAVLILFFRGARPVSSGPLACRLAYTCLYRIQSHTRHKSEELLAGYIRKTDKWTKSGLDGVGF
jgi:hypothetical protein